MAGALLDSLGEFVASELKAAIEWSSAPKREEETRFSDDGSNLRSIAVLAPGELSVQLHRVISAGEPLETILSDGHTFIQAELSPEARAVIEDELGATIDKSTLGDVFSLTKVTVVSTHYGFPQKWITLRVDQVLYQYHLRKQQGHPISVEKQPDVDALIGQIRDHRAQTYGPLPTDEDDEAQEDPTIEPRSSPPITSQEVAQAPASFSTQSPSQSFATQVPKKPRRPGLPHRLHDGTPPLAVNFDRPVPALGRQVHTKEDRAWTSPSAPKSKHLLGLLGTKNTASTSTTTHSLKASIASSRSLRSSQAAVQTSDNTSSTLQGHAQRALQPQDSTSAAIRSTSHHRIQSETIAGKAHALTSKKMYAQRRYPGEQRDMVVNVGALCPPIPGLRISVPYAAIQISHRWEKKISASGGRIWSMVELAAKRAQERITTTGDSEDDEDDSSSEEEFTASQWPSSSPRRPELPPDSSFGRQASSAQQTPSRRPHAALPVSSISSIAATQHNGNVQTPRKFAPASQSQDARRARMHPAQMNGGVPTMPRSMAEMREPHLSSPLSQVPNSSPVSMLSQPGGTQRAPRNDLRNGSSRLHSSPIEAQFKGRKRPASPTLPSQVPKRRTLGASRANLSSRIDVGPDSSTLSPVGGANVTPSAAHTSLPPAIPGLPPRPRFTNLPQQETSANALLYKQAPPAVANDTLRAASTGVNATLIATGRNGTRTREESRGSPQASFFDPAFLPKLPCHNGPLCRILHCPYNHTKRSEIDCPYLYCIKPDCDMKHNEGQKAKESDCTSQPCKDPGCKHKYVGRQKAGSEVVCHDFPCKSLDYDRMHDDYQAIRNTAGTVNGSHQSGIVDTHRVTAATTMDNRDGRGSRGATRNRNKRLRERSPDVRNKRQAYNDRSGQHQPSHLRGREDASPAATSTQNGHYPPVDSYRPGPASSQERDQASQAPARSSGHQEPRTIVPSTQCPEQQPTAGKTPAMINQEMKKAFIENVQRRKWLEKQYTMANTDQRTKVDSIFAHYRAANPKDEADMDLFSKAIKHAFPGLVYGPWMPLRRTPEPGTTSKTNDDTSNEDTVRITTEANADMDLDPSQQTTQHFPPSTNHHPPIITLHSSPHKTNHVPTPTHDDTAFSIHEDLDPTSTALPRFTLPTPASAAIRPDIPSSSVLDIAINPPAPAPQPPQPSRNQKHQSSQRSTAPYPFLARLFPKQQHILSRDKSIPGFAWDFNDVRPGRIGSGFSLYESKDGGALLKERKKIAVQQEGQSSYLLAGDGLKGVRESRKGLKPDSSARVLDWEL